ncbi:PalH/RIM21-domain-containing protein [Exophiala viscosa]|uniref:PalH/RIM21-domain-containing protein n=1 Tax=Exophiala viscosa TaxID=2486360 RepID=A0AAN6DNB0_9EURO|nr:PalH/RIM21-domain-containing protein [Exophiala viscosa]KAI1620157.1 PalH/RIM21-domain-containing protein [Exophiala viscosa]
MSNNGHITARQLWGQLTTYDSAVPTTAWCTPLILPSGGVLIFGDDQTTTLQARVTYKQPCDDPQSILSPDTTGNSSVIGFQDPFYASISPQVFALATATVISYVLVILIFITPRTFYGGGTSGGSGFLGRRGAITGSYGSSPVVGVGRRPLLQKIAAITVAISLTIATADTFRVAENQYNQGYMDSSQLVDDVVDSLEVRIIRIISDTFLWLAQVQTLIRLFPRHKEKVVIKWLGFVMVSLDTIFSILDSFISGPKTRPRKFQDAIPALNYLFELAISLIYASCVIYYCLSKRRFAFWHAKMKNICLVAVLALMSVLIPVVFFVLDISQPNLAGWGEYIRWVGAAAASVVVWEWVERIESLERDEKKDGILGREIFDGDEMLNMTPSEDASWRGRGSNHGQNGDQEKSFGVTVVSRYKRFRNHLPLRKRRRIAPPDGISTGEDAMHAGRHVATNSQMVQPEQFITPPSRSDTGSAASTVYAIRYQNLTSPSPTLQHGGQDQPGRLQVADAARVESHQSDTMTTTSDADKEFVLEAVPRKEAPSARHIWQGVPNPFKRRRAEPPAEVADAQNASGMRSSPIDRTLKLRTRLEMFASSQKDRFGNRGSVPAGALPMTVIPAPKGSDRTWSPDDLADETPDHGAVQADITETSADSLEEEARPQNAQRVVFVQAPHPGRTRSPDVLPDHEPGQLASRPVSASERQRVSIPSLGIPTGGQAVARHQPTSAPSDISPNQISSSINSTVPRSTGFVPSSAIEPIAEVTSEVGNGEAEHGKEQGSSEGASGAQHSQEGPQDANTVHPQVAATTAVPETSLERPPLAPAGSDGGDERNTGGT